LLCFFLQGWHNHPKGLSTKSLVLVGLGFAYVISIFFSASLTSNLASETVPIKTFTDLLNGQLALYGDRRLPVVLAIVKVFEKSDEIHK
jgi:hypothetical protein